MTETLINENKIRLSGIANLSRPFKRTNIFVDLTLHKATIKDDIDLRSNEDGTVNQIFKLVITPETEIKILAENEILIAHKKGSQSQKLRIMILTHYNQQFAGGDENFERFYQKEMSKIIENYALLLV